MTATRVSAVMPCLDEAESLGTCIRKAQAAFERHGIQGEVVVADNGSTDASSEIAHRLGARVIHERRRGYGAALKAGIEAACGEVVVMADADDSYDWSELGSFVAKIDSGYDLVVGNRFRGGISSGAMPFLHRYLGNPVLSAVARLVTGVRVGDFHCGMRAFTKAAYRRMALATDGMEFATEMVMNAARSGLRIGEIPTSLRPDARTRPPHLRSFRDGWRHLRFILTYAPDHLFLAPALAFLAVGLPLTAALAGGPIAIRGHFLGPHFLAVAVLLTLLGISTLSFGVLAKLIIARKHRNLTGWIVRWTTRPYALEGTLVSGVGLIALGLGIDSYILYRWLSAPGQPMETTVHPAIAATALIVFGVETVLAAFLLNLIVWERGDSFRSGGF